MNLAELNKVAEAMTAPGKGILAADESTGTIKKRFDAINTECTEDNRRDYREMMFRTSEAMKSHVSGVILYDETIWQKACFDTRRIDGLKTEIGPFLRGDIDDPLPRPGGRSHTAGILKDLDFAAFAGDALAGRNDVENFARQTVESFLREGWRNARQHRERGKEAARGEGL